MANEATIQIGLSINKGNLAYKQTATVRANVAGTNGPTPGAITVPSIGVDVTFSQLTAFGGLCWLANLDSTYTVQVGVKDTGTGVFYPLLELLPGEKTVIRLSRVLDQQESGTGTFSGSGCRLHLKTDGGGSAIVQVEAFDP